MDKFYTLPHVVDACVRAVGEAVGWSGWDLVVEPSAGGGAFLTRLPGPSGRVVGLDVAPEHPDVRRMDFFDYAPPADVRRVLVVGNPPFGRVCSLAVRFFNHAAAWAEAIAFVVPRTFRRVSLQNRLDRNFRLVRDDDVPVGSVSVPSFEPHMQAKCCFQVWVRAEAPRRPVALEGSHPDWTFLPLGPRDARGQPTPPEGASFAVRAYGANCGRVQKEGLAALRPKSWHWIRPSERVDADALADRIAALDFSVSRDTARQDSIGRGELVALYATALARTSTGPAGRGGPST